MLGLRTVVYKVDDLEKAKQWYAVAFKLIPILMNHSMLVLI